MHRNEYEGFRREFDISNLITESKYISNRRLSAFKPIHIFISDTVNYPAYPVKNIVNDTYKVEYYNYWTELQREYNYSDRFPPFHFFIEFIEYDWAILTARPFTLPPNSPTDNPILNNSVHILLMGDYSNQVVDKFLRIKLLTLVKSLYKVIIQLDARGAVNKTNFIYTIPGMKNILHFLNTDGFRINTI